MKGFFIVTILLCASCVTNTYNTPFINADETVQLNFGMDRDEVLSIMNEPLFVAYGDNDEIIWVAGQQLSEKYKIKENSVKIVKLNFFRN